MDNYITGAVIRKIRESKNMTQEELAEKIFVSGKPSANGKRVTVFRI